MLIRPIGGLDDKEVETSVEEPQKVMGSESKTRGGREELTGNSRASKPDKRGALREHLFDD